MSENNERSTRTAGWQLEGNSAEAYERYLVPGMFESWADGLVEQAGLQPGDHVLDVGCGTGVVARRAAAELDSDGQVVGLDLNQGMLDVARTESTGLGTRIEWRQGDATDLPFSAESFDVAFCQQALQFVSNPAAALREMRRVLVQGGRLALSAWRPIEFHSVYAVVADALDRHVGDEAATMMRSPFPSWDRAELRDLVREAGFRETVISIGIGSMRYPSVEEFVRREAASSPLAGPLGSLQRDVREALIRDVGEGLNQYTDDEGVIFPMETHVVAASR